MSLTTRLIDNIKAYDIDLKVIREHIIESFLPVAANSSSQIANKNAAPTSALVSALTLT